MTATSGLGWGMVLTGDKEVLAKLNRFNETVQQRIVKKAVRKGAKWIAQAAKRKAPVVTGLLKKSIGFKVGRARRSKATVIGIIGPRRGFKKIVDGKSRDPVRYAHLVEKGTSKTGAKPFLRPALEQEKGGAIQEIADEMRKEIERIMTK